MASLAPSKHCRVCGDTEHKTKDCPTIQSDEELDPLQLGAMEMDGISEASFYRKGGVSAMGAATPKRAPRTSPKQSPGKASSAWMEVPDVKQEHKPEHYFMDQEDFQLTPKEIEAIKKQREKASRSAAKRIETKALTGIQADYPSLSHQWSYEVPFNLIGSVRSRMVTFMWKKLVWQMRMKIAVEKSMPGARWKKNKRWLAMLFGKEIAGLWGHLGAARQRMYAPVAVDLM